MNKYGQNIGGYACARGVFLSNVASSPAFAGAVRAGLQAGVCSGVLISHGSPSSKGDCLGGDKKGWLRTGNTGCVYVRWGRESSSKKYKEILYNFSLGRRFILVLVVLIQIHQG